MKPSLPIVDGIGPSAVQLPEGAWERVLDFLGQRFAEIEPAVWIARMRRGRVLDEDGTPLGPDSRYRVGMRVFYYRELEREPPVPFEEEVLYRDEHILVADKPHFLAVAPAGRFLRETLLVRLRQRLGLEHLVPIHRIDRDTAGLVIFSLNPRTRGAYSELFPRREVHKLYEALAGTRPGLEFPLVRRSRIVAGEPFFRMREAEGEPNAETRIELLERRGAVARYRLEPLTGRKHQLRVHLAGLGIPIANDGVYPELRPRGDDDFARPLQLLAKAVVFRDPLSGEPRRFESRRHLLPDTIRLDSDAAPARSK